MKKSTCNQLVKSTVEKANTVFPGLNLKVPTIEFFNNSRSAGLANLTYHIVKFNEIIMSEQTDEAFTSTIIHEISHFVTYKLYPKAKQAHGPEFKWIMRKLGAIPNTYHNYSVASIKTQQRVQNKYNYYCSGCNVFHILSTTMHNRIYYKNEVRYCTKTRAPIMKENFVNVIPA